MVKRYVYVPVMAHRGLIWMEEPVKSYSTYEEAAKACQDWQASEEDDDVEVLKVEVA